MRLETPPNAERLQEDLQLLKEWISKQPHLPKNQDERWLATILHYNKYSLEKTKTKIENYFSFRTKYPELLKNRDPTSAEISQSRAAYKMIFADKLTKDGDLMIFGQMQSDTSIFEITGILKQFFMLFDGVHLKNDGHVHVMGITDCRYLSYVHFLKALPYLKIAIDIFFTAYSERVMALHIINAPANLDKVFNTIKGFLPKKIAERFYIHSTMEDLCKIVDENVVCSDFEGKGPSLAEYGEYTRKQVEKHREWFLAQDDICTNEALRPTSNGRIEDMSGSFRKLEVD